MNLQPDFKSLDRSLRKQRIIDAAVRIFHEKGYRAATLDDVARDLGITKAALYHYVSSKEELLSIIYIQVLARFFENAYQIGERDIPPPEKLRMLIRNHIKHMIAENLAMFAVFFSEENQLPEKDFQKIRREKRKYSRVVERVIEDGRAQGYFRETDTHLQAFAIIGMCNWLYKWYKPGEGGQGPDDIADHFIDLLEHGYLRRKDRPGETESEERTSPTRKRELLNELNTQLRNITEVIEELEKLA